VTTTTTAERRLAAALKAANKKHNAICKARDHLFHARSAESNKALNEITAKFAPKIKVANKAIDAAYAESQRIYADLSAAQAKACMPPAKGAFICYKKATIMGTRRDNYGGTDEHFVRARCIVVLEVPATAKRQMKVEGANRKCRASAAKVLSIETVLSKTAHKKGTIAYSEHDRNFAYKVGEMVTPKGPRYQTRLEVCAPGIHFYMRRKDAEAH